MSLGMYSGAATPKYPPRHGRNIIVVLDLLAGAYTAAMCTYQVRAPDNPGP